MIREVDESNLQAARSFLEAHVETSLFLLSNLALLGPRLGDHLNSGNYRCIKGNGEIVAVFCLTRRGNLLAQTGGRADLAAEILDACSGEAMRVEGVISEWRPAEALWRILCAEPHFEPAHTSKEVLYRLVLPLDDSPNPSEDGVRFLESSDFAEWEQLDTASLIQDGMPVQGSAEQRRANFVSQAAARQWWGAFEASRLVSIACLNATYGRVGQVGGVYTAPDERRKGRSRSVMTTLLRDAGNRHHLEKLILFTGESNVPARSMYESLGFERIGEFALLFGSWR